MFIGPAAQKNDKVMEEYSGAMNALCTRLPLINTGRGCDWLRDSTVGSVGWHIEIPSYDAATIFWELVLKGTEVIVVIARHGTCVEAKVRTGHFQEGRKEGEDEKVYRYIFTDIVSVFVTSSASTEWSAYQRADTFPMSGPESDHLDLSLRRRVGHFPVNIANLPERFRRFSPELVSQQAIYTHFCSALDFLSLLQRDI